MTGRKFLDSLNSPFAAELFSRLYGTDGIDNAARRYSRLVEGLLQDFPKNEFPEASGELRVFSVPGRTELGGNHTDHNQGKVLAASIQLDAAAVVAPRTDKRVFFRSTGHRDVMVDISDLSIREEEKGNTEALIRGIAAELTARGTPVNGFTANAANAVLTGSGLSSSAAIEVLIAKIFDSLYCGGKRSALELAQIGQKAENVYFGKPCGLMDQTACASGGAVAIDFADLLHPKVTQINFDPEASCYALCIVDTKATHADLTGDYAAIPNEMRAAAAFFGKTVLRELGEETLMGRIPDLRKAAGDRAVLRALHFYSENHRVDSMLALLEKLNKLPLSEKGEPMEDFLSLVRESGDSSWELLQNVYALKNPGEQGVSMALAVTKKFLAAENTSGGALSGALSVALGGALSGKKLGACRVHGGGFAGTIQAYIPKEMLASYRKLMEGIFGIDVLTVLRIRSIGAAELIFQ